MADHRLISAFAADGDRAVAVDTAAAKRGVSTTATAALVTTTLVTAAAAWVIAVWRMSGMDMGVATELGPFWTFEALWVAMMAAMMLPGVAPAALRHAREGTGVLGAPRFVGSYVAVWATVGFAVYAVYQPHGSVVAGAIVIAAGVYELTPPKRRFRQRCRDSVRCGLEFGLCCVGSSLGLMLILVLLGVMSVAWMVAMAVVVVAQKLMPSNAAIDVPIALAIVGLGIFVIVAPTSVPGLIPAM